MQRKAPASPMYWDSQKPMPSQKNKSTATMMMIKIMDKAMAVNRRTTLSMIVSLAYSPSSSR